MKAVIISLLVLAQAQIPTTLPECKEQLGRTVITYEKTIDIFEERLSDQITLCKIREQELKTKLEARTSTVIQAIAPEPVIVQEGFDMLEVTGIAIGTTVVGAAIGVLVTFFLLKKDQ